MLALPPKTELSKPKPLSKAAVYRRFDLSNKEKEHFDEDISRLFITNEITPETVNINAGKNISSFYVIRVELKHKNFDDRNIIRLSKLIEQNMLFVLEYKEEYCLAIYRKKGALMDNKEILKDYFLFRLFDVEKYLDDFIDGTCIRMNSAKKFHEISNKFQGDPNDCSITLSDDKVPFTIYLGKDLPEIEIGKTNLEMGINGYLCCFFAVPKSFFAYKDGELCWDEDSPYFDKINRCFEEYISNSDHKTCYFAAFDAYALVMRFEKCLKKIGVACNCGFINYTKLDSKSRLKLFADDKLEEIIMTKDPSYDYQSEFRIFARTYQPIDEWLDVKGIKLSDIVFLKAKYNLSS